VPSSKIIAPTKHLTIRFFADGANICSLSNPNRKSLRVGDAQRGLKVLLFHFKIALEIEILVEKPERTLLHIEEDVEKLV
jgi:hypothetical protein